MVRKSFTTLDLVLMALLAVANGLLTFYGAPLNKMLAAIGGPILTSTIVGIYMTYGMLAIYIIRKPGAALITYLIGATVQTLFLPNPYGVAANYVAAICYAIAIEAIFAIYRYKRWDYISVMFASVVAVPLWFVCAAYMFGYLKWGIPVLTIALLVRCVSGILLCGFLSKWVADRLAGAGLLRTFAIGAKGNLKPEG